MSKYYKAEDIINFLNAYCPKDMWEYQIADLPAYEVADISDEAYEVGYTAGQMAERKRIVHCEDCMFSKVYQNDSSGVEGRFCEAFTQVRMVTDDDFCSYGERKEE